MTNNDTVLDPNLPAPGPDDLTGTVFETGESTAFWTCRYCDFTERAALTTDAERNRAFAHMYACRARPADDVPDDVERCAYQIVHAAGLRRTLFNLRFRLDHWRFILRSTWFFDWMTRRRIRTNIADLSRKISNIYEHAADLGLDNGWTEENFQPRRTR